MQKSSRMWLFQSLLKSITRCSYAINSKEISSTRCTYRAGWNITAGFERAVILRYFTPLILAIRAIWGLLQLSLNSELHRHRHRQQLMRKRFCSFLLEVVAQHGQKAPYCLKLETCLAFTDVSLNQQQQVILTHHIPTYQLFKISIECGSRVDQTRKSQ